MPELKSKFEGIIPGDTWDLHISIIFKAINAGDARFNLREFMSHILEKRKNICLLKHGQEDWTVDSYVDFNVNSGRPYKTKMEVRIYAMNRLRARQELAQLMEAIRVAAKTFNIRKVIRSKRKWSEK